MTLNKKMRNRIDNQSYQTAHQSSIYTDELQIFSDFQFEFFTQFFAFPIADG